MLLRWVEDGRLERRDLLSDYRTEYVVEALRQIPRTRKTYILQYTINHPLYVLRRMCLTPVIGLLALCLICHILLPHFQHRLPLAASTFTQVLSEPASGRPDPFP